MTYTRPRSRGEAALSRLRCSHKISATDRGVFRVYYGRECVGTIVPVGVNTIDAVERPYMIAWDRHGNLLLRQDGIYEADHELRVSRNYFPQFVQALDVLREVIVDAIRKDKAP